MHKTRLINDLVLSIFRKIGVAPKVTNTHTHEHKHMHIHMHMHTLIKILPYTQIQTQKHTNKQTHTHKDTQIHTYIYAWKVLDIEARGKPADSGGQLMFR